MIDERSKSEQVHWHINIVYWRQSCLELNVTLNIWVLSFFICLLDIYLL